MNTPFSSFSLKLISYLNYMPVFIIVQESVMSFFISYLILTIVIKLMLTYLFYHRTYTRIIAVATNKPFF